MRSPSGLVLRIPLFLCVALAAWAGEPIPNIDVILEQNPGGTVKVDSYSGGFDEIELEVGKDFAEALSPVSLPEGWALETDGKRVRLAGPAVAAGEPVRFKLDAGSAPRPERISYWVRLEGRTLLERKKVPTKIVPPARVIGSLEGVVTMPTQVAPGEPMQMRVDDEAELPPDGTWMLSGTVVAEEESAPGGEPEPTEDSHRWALSVREEHADEVSDEVLEDVAAVLTARGDGEGAWEVVPGASVDRDREEGSGEESTLKVYVVAREATTKVKIVSKATAKVIQQASSDAEDVADKTDKTKPEIRGATSRGDGRTATGQGSIGAFAVRPMGLPDGSGAGLVVACLGTQPSGPEHPDGSGPDPPGEQKNECGSSQESASCCEKAGGRWTVTAFKDKMLTFCWERIETDKTCLTPITVDDPWIEVSTCVPDSAFSVVEKPGRAGSTLHHVELNEPAGTDSGGTYFRTTLSTSRSNLKKAYWGGTNPDGTVDLVVPADLEPGDSLAVQYVDAFGEVVVDVPDVPGVEVVETSPGGEPRITHATLRAFAGRRVCVCGTFPGPDAWNGLLLDGEALGPPVSASSRMAWVELPAGLAPGEHVFTGAPEPGFPAEDRASTLVLQVGGELDSSKLQRLETTPMRLWIEGTEEPLDLRVRNLTPGIISIDGGEDQVIRTSGGSPNQLERTVRGLSPGAFNIQYELAGELCPCGAGAE